MVKSLNSHAGSLWSTFHLTGTYVRSDRYIVLGLHSLTKLKTDFPLFEHWEMFRVKSGFWLSMKHGKKLITLGLSFYRAKTGLS